MWPCCTAGSRPTIAGLVLRLGFSQSGAPCDRARRWAETGSRKPLDHHRRGGDGRLGQLVAGWEDPYFTSWRDGHNCLWGQRIEVTSHRPVGEAFAVQHFHGRVAYQQRGWSAAGGRIGLVLVESTGNIWMMSRSDAR